MGKHCASITLMRKMPARADGIWGTPIADWINRMDEPCRSIVISLLSAISGCFEWVPQVSGKHEIVSR